MKKPFLASVRLAFSLYSRVPAPPVGWEEKNRRCVLCAFPFVGLVIGIFTALFALFLTVLYRRSVLPEPVLAVFLGIFPLWLSGGIHLDGFLDTLDALGSHASVERKLEILKDARVGAFAVMGFGFYILLWVSAMSGLLAGTWQDQRLLLGLPVSFTLSRACSAGTFVTLPDARKDGLKALLQRDADVKAVRIWSLCWAGGALGAVFCMDIRRGVCLTAAAAFLLICYIHMSRKQFGGVTGDLAGYYVTVQELCYLLVFVWRGQVWN